MTATVARKMAYKTTSCHSRTTFIRLLEYKSKAVRVWFAADSLQNIWDVVKRHGGEMQDKGARERKRGKKNLYGKKKKDT